MIGIRFGHYEIITKLGEGATGEVYRAKDIKLERQVALKFLRAKFAEDAERAASLEDEARILASLNHPNIAQIYDLNLSGDTRALVMELVGGPTLAQLMADGILPLNDSLSIAIQIVRALTAAHEQGIVHKDLKPQNIRLTANRLVKVLDFGLAQREPASGPLIGDAITLSLTKDGIIVGTVGYMAPEQVRGEAVDTRADIFSFGCIFYEMVTGTRAFARSNLVESLAATLHVQPKAASLQCPEIPSGLDSVIAHCLEKERSARFQSARDLEFVLTAFASGEALPPVPLRVASVAVLPFANLSADSENEFFADGITEDVIAHLAKIRSLRVISRRSIMGFKESSRNLREIGEKLGAATVVEGSVRRVGNRVRIVAQLVDTRTDEHLWSDTYEREITDIFTIQRDVALEIAAALSAQLSNDERARLDKWPTKSFQAYEHYVRGRNSGHNSFYRFSVEGFRRSLIDYKAAIACDPDFALAWAGVAESYSELCINGGTFDGSTEDAIRSAKAAAARSLAIDNKLAEAHSVSALIRFIFDFDWQGAEREFLTAIELSPGSAQAHEHYGWLCASLERYDDALREVLRAREIDPLLIKTDVSATLLRAGRIEEALEEARRVVRDDRGNPRAHSNLGWALIFNGDHPAGLQSLERASEISPGAMFLAQLGQAYATTGNVGQARKILQRLQDRCFHEFVSPYNFAYIYVGLGELDTAIDWLEGSFEGHSGPIYGVKGSFLFQNLRTHPRFVSLLHKMNLA